MPALIRSVNVGASAPNAGKPTPTGIDKQPVAAIDVAAPGSAKGRSGVAGDFIGDRRHHGGDNQAVYAVAREELDWWARELGRDLRDGCFGENLTTSGIDVDAAVLGEQWQVGSAVLQVTGPRIPCATFATRMQQPHWVRRFAERGRSGAYLAVVRPGTIVPGDAIAVAAVPEHGIDVAMAFRAWMGDRELARRIVAAGAGPQGLGDELRT